MTLGTTLSPRFIAPLSSPTLQESHWIYKGLTEDFRQCIRRLHCSCCKIDPARHPTFTPWNHQLKDGVKWYSTLQEPERAIIETPCGGCRRILNFSYREKHPFSFKLNICNLVSILFRYMNVTEYDCHNTIIDGVLFLEWQSTLKGANISILEIWVDKSMIIRYSRWIRSTWQERNIEDIYTLHTFIIEKRRSILLRRQWLTEKKTDIFSLVFQSIIYKIYKINE